MRKNFYLKTLLAGMMAIFVLSTARSMPTDILGITALSDQGCIGTSVNFSIISNFSTITNINITDQNPSPENEINATQSCIGCNSGSISLLTLTVTLTSGSVGGVDTFDLQLTSPNGFINNSGFAPLGQTGMTITFRFTVNVDAQPTAAIVPVDPLICNGAPTSLTAISTNGSSATSFSWTADGGNGSFQGDVNPGNSANAIVTDEDTYRVTITNACGFDSDLTSVGSDLTPVIDLSCMDNGDNTTTLTVDLLNAASDVTMQFFNDGSPQHTSPILNGPDTYMHTVNSVTFQMQDFTVVASNDCGNSSNMESCEILLPVELQYFQAKPEEESVMLEWSTLTEINNDFFTIEKSVNGVDFTPIAQIQGAGTSQQERSYSYIDEKAIAMAAGEKALFYRLKQTDFNGSFSYSNIVSIALPGAELLSINRLWQETTDLVVDFNVPPRTRQLEGSIYSMDGRLVKTQQFDVEKGSIQLKFNTSNLAPGMYMFSATDGASLISRKFVKL